MDVGALAEQDQADKGEKERKDEAGHLAGFPVIASAAIALRHSGMTDTWPVARIEVKRLHASTIVLAGSSGQALAFGPGHVERTPDAGERGVAVYSAHRDTHFAFLKNVTIGDEIDVTRRDGQAFRYRVDATSVVRFDASGIDPLAGGHELVLSTCWPFDALTQGPERYLVHATMNGNAPDSR